MSKCRKLLTALKYSEEQIESWESQEDVTEEQAFEFAKSAPIANDWKEAGKNDPEHIKAIEGAKWGQGLAQDRQYLVSLGIDAASLEGKSKKELQGILTNYYKEFVEKEGGTSKKALHELQQQLAEKENSLQEYTQKLQSFETEVIPQIRAEERKNYEIEGAFKGLISKMNQEKQIFSIPPQTVFELTYGDVKNNFDLDFDGGQLGLLQKGQQTRPYVGSEEITPEKLLLKKAEEKGFLVKANDTNTKPTEKEAPPLVGQKTESPKGFGYTKHHSLR